MAPPPSIPFDGLLPLRCVHDAEHAQVWEVRDHDGRRKALKFLTTDDPAIRAGLIHEAKLHGSLRHSGVAKLYDLVVGHDETLGLLMEWIEGPCLADVLHERGGLQLDTALLVFEDVVRAVRSMHARGVVHRDIKPENIMLRSKHLRDPVLLDFGLAKRLATDGVSRMEQGMSLWFTTLGTPEYMAPEQAKAPSEVDERADVFSLGCLLYELLTGHVAFEANDPDEAMQAAAKGRFVPVEQRVELPESLTELVHDLLSPDRDQRPPHCTAILRRLDGSHG